MRLFLPSFLMQSLINAPCSYLRQMDNFTGLVEFVSGTLWSLIYAMKSHSQPLDMRQILATICVLLWSFRLGGFLVYRMISLGPLDTRIDDMAKKYGKWIILGFWFGPHGFWPVLCCLPLVLLYAFPMPNVSLNYIDVLGLTIWFIGFGIEAIADQSKLNAKLAGRKDKYYHLGPLWNYCRNPNHCGEVFCWFGVSLLALNLFLFHPIYRYNLWILVVSQISPGFTLFAMVCEASLSSEIRNNKRYGHRSDYLNYRQRTSLLWPIPPALYSRLPSSIRQTLFFDWKMYDEGLKTVKH